MKDHIETKLESVYSLEGFETFNLEEKIEKYQNEVIERKVLKSNDELLVLQNECVKLPEEIETISLESKSNKNIEVISKDSVDNLGNIKDLKPLEKVSAVTRRRNAQ